MNKHLTLMCALLIGCPVEPKDIQEKPGKPGPGPVDKAAQPVDGKPPTNIGPGSEKGATPPDQNGALAEGGAIPNPPPLDEDGNPIPPEEAKALNKTANAMQGGEGLDEGFEPIGGNQPLPAAAGSQPADGGAQGSGEAEPALPPEVGGEVMPIYTSPPKFSDVITGDTITITVDVSGANEFNYEFVVTKNQDGRTQPKVVHMQSNAQTPISVEAPANYSQTVWLIVTADKTGDGPSPDDLVGVTEKPLTFKGEDLSFSLKLEEGDSVMESLPWFSRSAQEPNYQ